MCLDKCVDLRTGRHGGRCAQLLDGQGRQRVGKCGSFPQGLALRQGCQQTAIECVASTGRVDRIDMVCGTACALWESSAAEEPPSLADELARYLQEHCGEAFRSEALEARFYLSYKHLAEIFRKNTGMSPLQYHYDLQMREACRLLRTTTLGVSEIAARLGFGDALYFSRRFRQKTGSSPSQYRKALVLHL